jgi:hypothetical protein
MMYTARPALEQLYTDMAKFYDETQNGGLR